MAALLTQKVDEVLQSTKLWDPREIAGEVLRRCSATEKRRVLIEATSMAVHTVLSRRRMLSEKAADAAAEPATRAKVSFSPKVAAVRDDWSARLITPVRTETGFKRLADCRRADLLWISASLRDKAAKTLTKADWYDTLAAALPDETATVACLSADPTGVAA